MWPPQPLEHTMNFYTVTDNDIRNALRKADNDMSKTTAILSKLFYIHHEEARQSVLNYVKYRVSINKRVF